MHKIMIPVLVLLLTGCADIRGRVTPDLLALQDGAQPELAMHISGEEGTIRAESDLMNFPDAMCAAAGAEVSTGHISVLLLHANPAAVLPDYLENGWLAPTAQVVYSDTDAVSLLAHHPPSAEEIKAAVRTGLLPPRTADSVLADLMGGSGVTALTMHTKDGFRLAVWDAAHHCGTLSEDACRGLALLTGKYDTFTFSGENACFTVEHAAPDIRATLDGEALEITVSGKFRCSLRSGNADEVEPALTTIITAALTETVTQHGADLLHIQERARAGEISHSSWREMLRSAAITVSIHAAVS